MRNPTKVIVALSGGVDSAVAAYLVKKQGYEVSAVFMKNFSERIGQYECPWREDRIEAYRVAAHLGIPIRTWDFERAFHKRVIHYMVSEYQKGRTPNPDVVCNREIKFDRFLTRARNEGAQLIATGHYARIQKGRDGLYHLLKGVDRTKDQSYFLAQLHQQQLQHVLFPVGNLTKAEVRRIARRIRLPNVDRASSQGICFIGEVDMRTFLQTRIRPKRGEIVDTKGNVLGYHNGISFYTIGQRRGINIGGGPALYVVGKDVKQNRLIVGTKDELQLFSSSCLVTSWQWTAYSYHFPIRCKTKIRYRHNDQDVIIRRSARGVIRATFERPQWAVSPGQTLAAYQRDELIGSGIIAETTVLT